MSVPVSGAVVLVVASYVPAFVLRRKGGSAQVFWCLVAVTTALHAVSLWNFVSWPIPGAEWDAETFHARALEHARQHVWPTLSIGTKLYQAILTASYRLLGQDRWVGQSLSVFIASCTLLILNRTARENGITATSLLCGLALIVGLFPPFLFHEALTLREPFELLGFAGGFYFVLKGCRRATFAWVLPAAACFLSMGLFHQVLLGLALVLVAVNVLLVFFSRRPSRRQYVIPLVLLGTTVAVGMLIVVYVPATSENDYLQKLRDRGSVLAAVAHYRQQVEQHSPRTTYDVPLDLSSTSQSVSALGLNYIRYLFKPYYNDIESKLDLVPFLSSISRLALMLVAAWMAIRQRRMDVTIAATLLTYLIVTVLWSLGTTNYGQAFRHHAMTDWLLAFLAIYLLNGRPRATVESGHP